jgi:hypothetical protein
MMMKAIIILRRPYSDSEGLMRLDSYRTSNGAQEWAAVALGWRASLLMRHYVTCEQLGPLGVEDR